MRVLTVGVDIRVLDTLIGVSYFKRVHDYDCRVKGKESLAKKASR